MPLASDDGFRLDPKLAVSAIALAAFGLLLSYDLRLGAAAGMLLLVGGTVWLYLAVRYGSLSGTPSVRGSIVESARQHQANRRAAARHSGMEPESTPLDQP